MGVVVAFSYRLRGLLLRLGMKEFMCRQLFQSYFSKVISPSNYNRAAVTMAVVWSQSRRYNPHTSTPPKVFNF